MTTKQRITSNLTIGSAARETGLSVKAIRFYENGGYVRTVPRSDTGYRLYSEADLNRLRLIRRARQLGMALPEIRSLIEKVSSADCNQAMGHLSGLLSKQREAIDAQIAELEALRTDLDRVEEHLRHCECAPGAMADECDYCLIPDQRGGECK
jgi:MerR family copper efflux transcriptional regulator